MLIKKAIFLDTKRYLLKFNKADKDGKTFKMKFNGINFKTSNSLQNWNDGSDKDTYEALYKMYMWFLKNPGKVLNKSIIQERWSRNIDGISINSQEMTFQVNPSFRNNWDGNVSYPRKLKIPKKPLEDKGYESFVEYKFKTTKFSYLGEKTTFVVDKNYNYNTNNYGLFSALPLSCVEDFGDEDYTIKDLKENNRGRKLINNKFKTSFVRCKKTQKILKRIGDDFYEFDCMAKNKIKVDKNFKYEDLIIIPNESNSPKLDIGEVKLITDNIIRYLFGHSL